MPPPLIPVHYIKKSGFKMDITSLNIFQYCKFLRHTGKIMLLIVFAITGLAGYSSFSAFLVPQIQAGGALAALWIVLSILYSLILLMVVWSYFACFSTDPGGVPPAWHPFGSHQNFILQNPDVLEEILQQHQQQQQLDGLSAVDRGKAYLERPRFCKKCQNWKPPRAHHCSVQARCVLKMDHYCIWVVNTVGLLNYKAFVLFLGYAFVGCLASAVMLVKPCIDFVQGRNHNVEGMLVPFISFVFTAAFTLALLGFLIMHLRLIAINQTTIEAYEKRPIKPWPYDKGTKRNFIEIFGRNKHRWLLPTHTAHETLDILSSYLDFNVLERYDIDVEAAGGGVGGSGGSSTTALNRMNNEGLTISQHNNNNNNSGVAVAGFDVYDSVINIQGTATGSTSSGNGDIQLLTLHRYDQHGQLVTDSSDIDVELESSAGLSYHNYGGGGAVRQHLA